jgi:hypothetical protein
VTCCHAEQTVFPGLVRLPDDSAVAAASIKAVRAAPRRRRGDVFQPAEAIVYLDDGNALRFPASHFPKACHYRDGVLTQLGVPPFPAYEGPEQPDDEPADEAAAVTATTVAAPVAVVNEESFMRP